jgi:hypothetical protein
MQRLLIMLAMALGLVASANAQMSVGVGISQPGLSIGINFSTYPRLVPVPGYPVYYYPGGNANYFFYDGLYWVYEGDNWYSSSWYNGPWELMDPYYVPAFVLRVPVRYYQRPPVYFRGWRTDAPPRWDQHWGRAWTQRRSGWDRWDRRTVPRPAPLPSYQSQYSGIRYPRAPEQQYSIRSDSYRYQPRDSITRHSWQPQWTQGAPVRQQQRPGPPAQQQQPPQRPRADTPGWGRDNAPATQSQGRHKDSRPQGRDRDKEREEHGQGPR